MTWETMTPDQQNRWLAEKAMGWSPVRGAGNWSFWRDKDGMVGPSIKDYSPTTDPAAALGLLEDMRSKGHFPITVVFCTSSPKYFVAIGQTMATAGISVYADTLSAAICACVWQALGGKDA